MPTGSFVHRLNPAIKVAATFLFVIAVALLPRFQVAAVLANFSILAVVVIVARLPLRTVLGRLAVVAPFVSFAFVLPFVASGPRTDVWGLALSTEGLWASWSILTKALLGAGSSIVLSSTTSIPDLLRGLSALRVPTLVVAIIAFMFRYLDVISGQVHRMHHAMIARAHDPRWLWQVKPMAVSAGALFVRSYERGERTHLGMMARCYTGDMPDIHTERDQSRRVVHTAFGFVPAALAWLNLAVSLKVGLLR